MVQPLTPSQTIFLRCFSGAAIQNVDFFGDMLIGYAHFIIHFMQFPAHHFELDHYGCRPLIILLLGTHTNFYPVDKKCIVHVHFYRQ